VNINSVSFVSQDCKEEGRLNASVTGKRSFQEHGLVQRFRNCGARPPREGGFGCPLGGGV
jgi:hypothetical protein